MTELLPTDLWISGLCCTAEDECIGERETTESSVAIQYISQHAGEQKEAQIFVPLGIILGDQNFS